MMRSHLRLIRSVVMALSLILLGVFPSMSGYAEEGGSGEHDPEMDHHHEAQAVEAMSSQQQHMGPHMKWTSRRTSNSVDQQRAAQIVQTLREALEKYKDYRVALKDGYQPPSTKFPQPHYHFTNKANAFKGAFTFNPAEPTSLLYTKTPDGYELEGAMYTAPKRMTEDDLDQRVPLSVAQWHAHVNICRPPPGTQGRAAWKKFGFKGSIASEEECTAAGGRFLPQIYGWMIHVYPFRQSPEQIWTH
jgi:hypothetical protein